MLTSYITRIEKECLNLINALNFHENLSLKSKNDLLLYREKNMKWKIYINKITFQFHGVGCTMFNDNLYIDWDFGYGSRWCGIEPWLFANTLKKNNFSHVKYYDGSLVKELCQKEVLNKTMFEKNNLYYFSISDEQLFEPNFPKQFDVLIIEYFNFRWILPRDKLVDKFLRKSKKIAKYSEIYSDDCTLRFFYNHIEIYSIHYDDVGYPKNAVNIMSNQIIANLLKQEQF